jgi:voltage-gated potassium channel
VVSKTIMELQIGRELGVIVMAIRKVSGEMVFNPPADMAIRGGDHLIAMGRPHNLQALEALVAGHGAV